MSVTPETSHGEMSPLNDLVSRNIPDMSVTPETSHGEMSPLKEAGLITEHSGHGGHGRDVPWGDVAVEGVGLIEHCGHGGHGRDVPLGRCRR